MTEKLVIPWSEVTLRDERGGTISPSRDLVFEFTRPTGELHAVRSLKTVIWIGDDWALTPFNNLDVERALEDGAPFSLSAPEQLRHALGRRYQLQLSRAARTRLTVWFDAQRMALGGLDPKDFPKRCKCGRKYTVAQWKKLQLVGTQGDEPGYILELRNCVCKSTLAVGMKNEKELLSGIYPPTVPTTPFNCVENVDVYTVPMWAVGRGLAIAKLNRVWHRDQRVCFERVEQTVYATVMFGDGMTWSIPASRLSKVLGTRDVLLQKATAEFQYAHNVYLPAASVQKLKVLYDQLLEQHPEAVWTARPRVRFSGFGGLMQRLRRK